MARRTPIALPLPCTVASLRQVLSWGAHPETSPYAHLDLVEWCRRFRESVGQDASAASHDAVSREDAPSREDALSICEEVEARWEQLLVEGWPIEALLTLDLSAVQLPTAWFEGWLRALDGA